LTGTFYIVSTHIGNIGDLTFRSKRVLTQCDFVICEELKPAKNLLKQLDLFKELIPINEHTEKENSHLVIDLLKEGKNCCLISDSGTPIFSDPGLFLLELVRLNEIKIEFVPGPDSLIPSLVGSGFDISKFYYAGWLSPKSEVRKEQLRHLKSINLTIAIMETPYRLRQLISDVMEIFGKDIQISLACDLTTENEKFIRGKIEKVYNLVIDTKMKCEFVLIIDNSKKKGVNI
jgi:16S rRNA (cytidine1402-2'-O)-methyltransferase